MGKTHLLEINKMFNNYLRLSTNSNFAIRTVKCKSVDDNRRFSLCLYKLGLQLAFCILYYNFEKKCSINERSEKLKKKKKGISLRTAYVLSLGRPQ